MIADDLIVQGSKVRFKIKAGAPNNNIHVNSSGKVGFQTPTPVLVLHEGMLSAPSDLHPPGSASSFDIQSFS